MKTAVAIDGEIEIIRVPIFKKYTLTTDVGDILDMNLFFSNINVSPKKALHILKIKGVPFTTKSNILCFDSAVVAGHARTYIRKMMMSQVNLPRLKSRKCSDKFFKI